MHDPNHSLTWSEFVIGLLSDSEIPAKDIAHAWEQADNSLEQTTKAASAFARQRIHAERRSIADAAQLELHVLRLSARTEVASWSVDKIRMWLEQAIAGAQGQELQKLANALYCHRDDSQPITDEEARVLVADILAARPSPPKT